MNNFGEKVNFIWSIAELLRDTFKRSKYQDVILPLTVLRRIDCVLEPTKQHVLEVNAKLKGKFDNLAANLHTYINAFSDNMREVLEKFDFNSTISKLDEAGLLFLVMEKFKNIDMHPDKVSNHEMGYIFEELVRKFNEALNENPGEHFTPREVVPLILIRNVNDFKIDETDIPRISEEDAERLFVYRLNIGDIVFSRVGSIGRIALCTEHEKRWLISGQMLRLRIQNPMVNSRFSMYAFSSKSILTFIEEDANSNSSPSRTARHHLLPRPPDRASRLAHLKKRAPHRPPRRKARRSHQPRRDEGA